MAGTIQNHKIWRVTQASFLLIGSGSRTIVSDAQMRVSEKGLLEHLERILNSGFIYFSTTYDLTHSLQHNAFLNKENKNTIIDDRYCFNHFLRQKFNDNELLDWTVKSIFGYCGSVCLPLDQNYTLTLISRTSTKRLGTRYLRRGLDQDGNAANNVEMEQIVFSNVAASKRICSFVQLRGSVPAIWAQVLDLKYKPRIVISQSDESVQATNRHLLDLRKQYCGEVDLGKDEKVVCVNLLDDRGHEGPLTAHYQSIVRAYGDETIHYEGFPITKWCKKMNYKNMEILLARVSTRMFESGIFAANGQIPSISDGGDLSVEEIQKGVMRVSCLDSLDRTNLTCTLFAKYMLPVQLAFLRDNSAAFLNMDDERNALSPHSPLISNLWADSGDAISLCYAGTKAMRGDITRTGSRAILRGPIEDGMNAITRYYLNNISDGRKQDAYDVWTGKVDPKSMIVTDLDSEKKSVSILRDHSIFKFVPNFLMEKFEYLLDSACSYVNLARRRSSDETYSVMEVIVSAIKSFAPNQVTNVLEFFFAMVVFFYVLVLVKIFQLQGEKIVEPPRFLGFDNLIVKFN